MKILVTGCSGTIGTRLCERLMADGHDVVGADWEPCRWQASVEAIRIDADLRHDGAFKSVPTDIEAIVHLAANARVYELVENPERALDNLKTLFNTLEFARKNNVPRLIFASSREGYGNIDAETLSEDMVRVENCESPYTASKVGGEALVHAYRQCYDIQTIIVRFSNVYGMYDDSVRVVPRFFRQAMTGEPMTVFGKDKCLDFTYIDDAVSGVCLCLDQFEKVNGETFNFAVGEGVTLVRLAERMKELTGSESEIVIGESRTGEVIRYVADISKAKKMLGYDPQTPFDSGIEKTVEWYKSNIQTV